MSSSSLRSSEAIIAGKVKNETIDLFSTKCHSSNGRNDDEEEARSSQEEDAEETSCSIRTTTDLAGEPGGPAGSRRSDRFREPGTAPAQDGVLKHSGAPYGAP